MESESAPLLRELYTLTLTMCACSTIRFRRERLQEFTTLGFPRKQPPELLIIKALIGISSLILLLATLTLEHLQLPLQFRLDLTLTLQELLQTQINQLECFRQEH